MTRRNIFIIKLEKNGYDLNKTVEQNKRKKQRQ